NTIPGHKRFTPAQRAPSIAAAEANADSPSWTTKPRDQSRRVVRPVPDRSRSPAPVIVVIDPATVVEGSIAPRLVVNPGPAPRIDPNPVTVPVRRPPHSNAARNPD